MLPGIAAAAQHPPSGTAGTAWVYSEAPIAAPWLAVAFGDGAFNSVGNAAITMRSTDKGKTWSGHECQLSIWTDVKFGAGVWVAVGRTAAAGTAMRSTDGGQTWDPIAVPSGNWRRVAFGNGVWIAVSDTLPNASHPIRAMRSTDAGVTWSELPLPTAAVWSGVEFGENTFAIISSSEEKVARSSDGADWVQMALPSHSTASFDALTYGDGTWVAYLTNPDFNWVACISTDLEDWNVITIPTSGATSWHGLVGAEQLLIALGDGGNNRAILSRDRGRTWQIHLSPGVTNNWYDVAYGDGVLVGVGIGAVAAMTSE